MFQQNDWRVKLEIGRNKQKHSHAYLVLSKRILGHQPVLHSKKHAPSPLCSIWMMPSPSRQSYKLCNLLAPLESYWRQDVSLTLKSMPFSPSFCKPLVELSCIHMPRTMHLLFFCFSMKWLWIQGQDLQFTWFADLAAEDEQGTLWIVVATSMWVVQVVKDGDPNQTDLCGSIDEYTVEFYGYMIYEYIWYMIIYDIYIYICIVWLFDGFDSTD